MNGSSWSKSDRGSRGTGDGGIGGSGGGGMPWSLWRRCWATPLIRVVASARCMCDRRSLILGEVAFPRSKCGQRDARKALIFRPHAPKDSKAAGMKRTPADRCWYALSLANSPSWAAMRLARAALRTREGQVGVRMVISHNLLKFL